MPPVPSQTNLFAMLRSYTALAHSLNLAETTAALGLSRQTVRRHIAILEELKGEKLFEVRSTQYRLTDAGKRSLKEAEDLLARGEAWLNGGLHNIESLDAIREHGTGTRPRFYAQQRRLADLWVQESPLLQCGLRCWVEADTAIASAAFAPVRPYLVVYRRYAGSWLCVEIGEKSSYTSWFGWTWAKSNVGRPIKEMPTGESYGRFTADAYEKVYEGQSVRLDHIHIEIPRVRGGPLVPVSYQRLLLGCTFPDGEFALALLVDRTYNLAIDGVGTERIRSMPEDLVMDFGPEMAPATD